MNYQEYREYIAVRNLAWEILIREQINTLPIQMTSLCRRLGIVVKLRDLDTGGKSTVIGNRAFIFVNAADPPTRQRFSIGHELGHILLGHVGKYELVCREPSPTDNPIETAANRFSARLLAPSCVLWGCGVQTADEIAELCNISKTAAIFRMERMKLLYERQKFLTNPLEQQVYKQFGPFIQEHKIRDRPERRQTDQ